MKTHRIASLLLAAALLAAGGGRSSKPAASASPTSDFADASSGGDKLSAEAIRKDAAFTCPAAAASVGRAGPALNGRKLKVATTVAPITSIVANVAGDKAEVHGVIPEGSDSHTYEPKPSVAQ